METQDQKYIRAQARLKELKKFYASLGSYILVTLFLLAVNYLTDWDHKWFLWVVLGWGLGIALHAFKVFGFFGIFGRDWEERKIKELMDKDETDKWQ